MKRFVILLSFAVAACSGESGNQGDSNVSAQGSAKGDAHLDDDLSGVMEEDIVADAPEEVAEPSSDIWNACVRGLGGAKISDVFESPQDELGFTLTAEETGNGAIVRMTKADALTGENNVMSYEFNNSDLKPESEDCGPRVVTVGRAQVKAGVAGPRDAIEGLAIFLAHSTRAKEHDARVKQRQQNEGM